MPKKPELRDFFRNAKNGRFVSEDYHRRHRSTTEHERRPVPSPVPEHKHQPRPKGK